MREKQPDLQDLFHAALEQKADERAVFLREACGEDHALRARIEALLAAHEEAGSFLEQPAFLMAGEPMTGAPLPPPSALEVGRTLSHFRILAKIGEGGMGQVYLAEDSRLKRRVALKALPAEMIGDPGWRRRFQREAETLAALNHPNIVTIYSVERSGPTRFLTMEYVEGRSLDRLLRPGGLDLPEMLAIGAALAEALVAAHEKGIVHRDIKPANVMLGVDGRVKVLDFGLAKAWEPAAGQAAPSGRVLGDTLSQTGTVMGTTRYMSPEHFQGGPLDARSDIFSLGVVLYELATGTRPFTGEDAAAVVSSIQQDTPPAVTELRPGLPDRLERLIARCLEKDREHRFQSVREVLDELTEQRRAMEPGSLTQARRPRWRARAAILGVAVVIAVAAVWLARGALPTGSRSARGSPDPLVSLRGEASLAVLPFADLSPEQNLQYFADGLAEEVIAALSRIRGLRVVGRGSSFQFRDRNADLRAVGQALNVDTILQGSLRVGGNRVRVTAQLASVLDGHHLWSDTYDRQLDDILSVQADIARSVAAAMKVTLLGRPENVTMAQPLNAEAYDAYLQGRFFFERQNEGAFEQSIERFKEALRLEPDFAPAWVWLSAAYCGQADQGYVTMEEGYARCREAAERAVALDDSRGQAHANVGWIKMNYDWDWEGAETAYRLAMELEPGNVHVVWHSAFFAMNQGRLEEAMALALRATELEPMGAMGHFALATVASAAGRLDEAERAARKGLELNPGKNGGQAALGLIHLQMGRGDEALRDIEREVRLGDRLHGLALTYHTLGRRQSADAALQELINSSGNSAPYEIAQVYAHRGEIDNAFRWLDRAYASKVNELPWIKTDPFMRNLERDPRYHALLRKMQLD